jgi:predicted ATPase
VRLITDMDKSELAAALDELVNSGLVFRRGTPPHTTFVFKHALVRDAAYAMLLRQDRQKHHACLARTYEDSFQDVVESKPELLAHHFHEAGNSIKSISYFVKAAEQALPRSAVTEALAHLGQARNLIMILPENMDRLRLELKLEILLGRTLTAKSGYTAPETRQAYQRARELCEALDDQASLPLVILGQWLSSWSAADHQSALNDAKELYSWGKSNSESAGMAVGHLAFGMTLTPLGDLINARYHLEQGLRINQFMLAGSQAFLSSDTAGRVSLLTYLHDCLLLLGFPDKARTVAREALSLRAHDMYSHALGLIHTLRMQVLERDVASAAATSAAVFQLSEDQGYTYFIGTSLVYRGWVLAQSGDSAAGIQLCERGLTLLRVIGAKCWLPRYLGLLAECYEQTNSTERRAEVIAEALESVEDTGERLWESEIHRLKGRFLLHARRDEQAAETSFVHALDKAREKNAKLLELRAAVSLTELSKHKRSNKQFYDLLSTVYAGFKEGLDLMDLREAKLLLDNLSESGERRERGNMRPKRKTRS